ncbi:hypothetical protein Nepgr_024619 [Nepenthes gracilis]|uniref:Uncharacterized protein n=1 Tax=Nepenthes gracilis TaxID=150966 RepID=A0AAD3T6A1_NEPGR|nr:hypothetical protein Nepgr_024619 [Nepenthes gracilis]
MSAGVHAKMSVFYRKNMISSLRNVPLCDPPTCMHLSQSSGFSVIRSVASSNRACCKVISSRWSSSPVDLVLPLGAICDI